MSDRASQTYVSRVGSRRWEAFWRAVAWRLPAPLTYWAAVRVGAHATTGEFGSTVVPDLTFMDALKRWERPRG